MPSNEHPPSNMEVTSAKYIDWKTRPEILVQLKDKDGNSWVTTVPCEFPKLKKADG